MRFVKALFWFALGFCFSLVLVPAAYPHDGGLDAYGCHHDRKASGYYCHRGQFTGRSFQSKDEMRKKLVKREGHNPKNIES